MTLDKALAILARKHHEYDSEDFSEAFGFVTGRLAALERVAAAAVAYESSASSYEGASRLDESFAKSNLFAALAALRESEGGDS